MPVVPVEPNGEDPSPASTPAPAKAAAPANPNMMKMAAAIIAFAALGTGGWALDDRYASKEDLARIEKKIDRIVDHLMPVAAAPTTATVPAPLVPKPPERP